MYFFPNIEFYGVFSPIDIYELLKKHFLIFFSTCHKDVKLVNPSALPSLRQTVFAKRFKLPETRLNEQNLVARAEILRLRISLLQQERNRRKKIIEDIKVST